MLPSISVLIPNFNHARYLPRTLEALLKQSYQPIEIIVLDDCSTDNSEAVVRAYVEQHSHVVFQKNEVNMGAAKIGNKLLSLARGEYVYFAGADDQVLPGFLEASAKLLEKNSGVGLCSARARIMDENSVDIGAYQSRLVSSIPEHFSPEQVLALLRRHGNWIVGCTVIFQRRALLEIGGFAPDLGPFIDGFTQQVIGLQSGACFLPEQLVYWRQSRSGYSQSEVRKVDQYFGYVTEMVHLMKTNYSHIFPTDYIEKFEDECLCGGITASVQGLKEGQDRLFERARSSIRHINPADRLALLVLSWVAYSALCLIKAYTFLRQRKLTIEMLRRRTIWLFERLQHGD